MNVTGRTHTIDASGPPLLRLGMDTRLLVVTLFLMALGLSLVLSSSSFFAGGKFGDHFALMRNHAARSPTGSGSKTTCWFVHGRAGATT